MKKVIYLFALMATVLLGCNPLEDVNAEIDALPDEPNVGSFEYTLTTEDYENFNLPNGFEDVDQAKDSIPQLLSELYALYGQGSSVLVNYELQFAGIEGVSNFTDSDVYSLSNADYASTGSDAFGFYPDVDATEEIPSILDAQIMAPMEGQYILVEYDQYTEEPTVGIADLYRAEFPSDYNDFERVTIVNPDPASFGWTETTSNVTGNGFDSSVFEQLSVEEYLISPQIDLSGQSDVIFEITQEIDFIGNPDLIDILVSTTYTPGSGIDPADWTALSFDKFAYGSLTTSPDIDFSAYDGEEVYIALKYSSIGEDVDPAPNTGDAARWRVESFAVKAIGVDGDTNAKGEYFIYEGGSWEEVDNVYYLSMADYDSMGEEFGQPGRFDNFSGSVLPENYLPQFLNIKYPFAQEEDQLFVIYKYFSGGVGRRGNSYTFTNGEWLPFQASLQFGFDDGQWVPDNTIRYTITPSDFDYIEANYAATTGFEDAVSSMANFGNFDRRPTNDAYWSNEMILTVFADLLNNVIDPSAEDGQQYVISVAIYDGSNGIEDFSLIKTDGEWVYNVD